MTFLSSFELLVEPITPKKPLPINPPGAPDPLVVQAFFALFSNIGSTKAELELKFTASPKYNLNLANTFAVFDTDNQSFTVLTPSLTPTTAKVSFLIEPEETGLFLLQPNIADLIGDPINVTKAIFGTRGFVEVLAYSKADLLISPQTRGTFIDPNTGNVVAQEAYPLPTTKSTNNFKF